MFLFLGHILWQNSLFLQHLEPSNGEEISLLFVENTYIESTGYETVLNNTFMHYMCQNPKILVYRLLLFDALVLSYE